jgi:hypothetical protein
MEGAMENWELNISYWYHSKWKEDGSSVGGLDEENEMCLLGQEKN